MNSRNIVPDSTPSADAREMYHGKNPGSDYGPSRDRFKNLGSIGLPVTIKSTSLESQDDVGEIVDRIPEQLDLFTTGDDEPKLEITETPETERYGHVEGASARVLRRADEITIRQQYREGRI